MPPAAADALWVIFFFLPPLKMSWVAEVEHLWASSWSRLQTDLVWKCSAADVSVKWKGESYQRSRATAFIHVLFKHNQKAAETDLYSRWKHPVFFLALSPMFPDTSRGHGKLETCPELICSCLAVASCLIFILSPTAAFLCSSFNSCRTHRAVDNGKILAICRSVSGYDAGLSWTCTVRSE